MAQKIKTERVALVMVIILLFTGAFGTQSAFSFSDPLGSLKSLSNPAKLIIGFVATTLTYMGFINWGYRKK